MGAAQDSRVQSGQKALTWPVAVRGWLAARDPGMAGLRRGARAALVTTTAFAFAKGVVGDAQFTTFLVFGCFALIVLADFGGRRPPRAAAYVTTTVIGALLVALGSVTASDPWTAALGMFLVGACVQFAGVFGGYAAAGQTALQLSYILASSIAVPAAAIGPRLAGWCAAGILATLAGTLLWPRFERDSLRREAAAACRAIAALITTERRGAAAPDLPAQRDAARAAVDAVRRSYAATSKRPAGPARRDRAFAELLAELGRILALTTGPLDPILMARHPCLEAGQALAAAVARTLGGSADLLEGGAPPDLLALQRARLAHRDALDAWAEAALRDGTDPAALLDGLQTDEALRVVSYLVLATGSDAVIATGGVSAAGLHLPEETPTRGGPLGTAARVAATVRAEFAPSSPVLHASLRVGLGLGLAVLISRSLRLDHSFWVVLGSLSVLRTTVLATGRTTFQAIAGTSAGFAISALVMAAAGDRPAVLWSLLPVAIFLAAYAATAFGFVAGQAAFTVTVVILFNLIAPAGWRLGLVRVEDVAIGAGISLVVGLLLWPRGARGEFRRALAELFGSVGVFLGRAFDHTLQEGTRDEVVQARAIAVRAHARAAEAFDRLLRERSARSPEPQVAASLVAAGGHAVVAGDLLSGMAVKGYQAPGEARELAALHAQAHALVDTFVGLAEQLERMLPQAPTAHVSDDRLREAVLRLLGDWQAKPGKARAAITAVALAEWVHLLGRIAARLEEPVASTVEAARVPWWR
jgi:uncharacterized membrane protein YccC